ncbi:MAG: mercuric transport protein MerTP [Cyclobacteriaceae bacterium]|nr:mercuric transport protein MerTP [Cyclobacteriaceae bacterium]
MKTESQKGWMLGIVTAVAASLCCITPVLALISGVGGIAATFSWLEPARPYLVGITIAALGFAWYQKLKPRNQADVECDCEEEEGKTNFWQSKTFLGIITVFAVATLTFPAYSHVFYPKSDKQVVIVKDTALKTVDFSIAGMTCTSCEEHVKHAVNELEGVLESSANYKEGTASVKFDDSKITVDKLTEAINATGYKVEKYEIQNSASVVKTSSVFQAASVNKIELLVKGMTCSGCEEHIKHAVNELDGVIEASASYKDGKAVISYDASKTSPKKIKEAINGTGYKVVEPN